MSNSDLQEMHPMHSPASTPLAVYTVLLVFPLWIFQCAEESIDRSAPNVSEGSRSVSSSSTWYNFVIDGRHEGGRLTVTLNGFPVEQSTGMMRYRESRVDLSPVLIGRENHLEIRSEPLLLRSGTRIQVGDPGIVGWVRRGERKIIGAEIAERKVDSVYGEWRQHVQKKWDEYLEWEEQWLERHPDSARTITSREGGALDSIRAWAERNPMTVSTTFDNEAGPDFSRIFEEASVIEGTPADTARLKDYAMRLRDLMARRDTAALFEEFRLYYAHQYEITGHEGSVEDDEAALRENVVMEDPDLDFEREDIRLTRWSDGRVWELARNDAEEFFQSNGTVRDVYVAELDGELRVVR